MLAIRRAQVDESDRVLRLLFDQPDLPPAALEQQVRSFRDYVSELGLDLAADWIVADRSAWQAVGALLVSPGRTAMLMLTAQAGAALDAALDLLLPAALATAREQRVRLVQVLIEPDGRETAALARHGFERLAFLDYLDRAVASRVGLASSGAAADEWRWIAYSAQTHALFATTIEQTYINTCDCPVLSGVRKIDDIIAGHRAATRFDPAWWQVLACGDQPAGCLLLGYVPPRDAAEVVYMGVCPESRGRGLGRVLLTRAVELSRGANVPTLTLAVDSSNGPALRLYAALGFRRGVRRAAWINLRFAGADG
ncbi:MAG: GNAT family N-acetyltransferase [Phycisphaerae bacterium]